MLAIAYGAVLTASGLWIWRRVLKDYVLTTMSRASRSVFHQGFDGRCEM